jgi:hypothetical protein
MKDFAFPQALLPKKKRNSIPKPMLEELGRLFRAECNRAFREGNERESWRLYLISKELKEKAK